jgi:DNA polymerase-3 subunit chi
MTEVRFYHLQKSALESALPPMLEKTLARGQRALVMAGSAERVEALAAYLWTYNDRGFLPHGTARDGFAERQPVWLTEKDENPNGANVLFLADGATSAHVGDFELCVELLDGNDEAAVVAGRDRWRAYQGAGHKLTYWQQDAAGRWEKKAEA